MEIQELVVEAVEEWADGCKEDISSLRLSYFFRTLSLVDHREGPQFCIFY